MIKTENLSKIFRTEEVETVALNGVSINVEDGEFVAIMGPSGCGKSTLLNILGLLDNPNSGEYWLDGEPVGKLKESERTHEVSSWQNRLRVPELQSHRRAYRRGERRPAATLPQRTVQGTP